MAIVLKMFIIILPQLRLATRLHLAALAQPALPSCLLQLFRLLWPVRPKFRPCAPFEIHCRKLPALMSFPEAMRKAPHTLRQHLALQFRSLGQSGMSSTNVEQEFSSSAVVAPSSPRPSRPVVAFIIPPSNLILCKYGSYIRV